MVTQNHADMVLYPHGSISAFYILLLPGSCRRCSESAFYILLSPRMVLNRHFRYYCYLVAVAGELRAVVVGVSNVDVDDQGP